jgi:hypothetical protein
MTEHLAPETTIEPALEAPQGDEQAAHEQEDQSTDKGSREAAKYRRQLRDVEAERDLLQTSLDSMRRQHVEAIIQEVGYTPEAVLLSIKMSELLAEDGTIDADLVKTITRETATRLGLKMTGPSFPKPDPFQGGDGRSPSLPDQWVTAFTPK